MYACKPHHRCQGQWVVEDSERGEGTVFFGPDAERRARSYAQWMNGDRRLKALAYRLAWMVWAGATKDEVVRSLRDDPPADPDEEYKEVLAAGKLTAEQRKQPCLPP